MGYRTGKRITLSLTWLFLELAIVFSVFSQIGPLEKIARPGMYAMWFAVLVSNCIKNRGKIQISAFTQRFFIAYILFCLYCVITGLFNPSHLQANYIHVLLIPLLMTLAGDFYVNEDKALFNRIGKLYLVCSLILAVWVQLKYFSSYESWLHAEMYVYHSKNSGGQIWISAILVSVCLLEYKREIEKILIYIGCAYLLFITAMSQCRTSLLGILVAVIAVSVFRSKYKVRWIVLIAFVVIAMWIIPVTRQFLEQALLLNKYEGADLNTFSSGRLDFYEKAFQKILSSPIFGNGKAYVDCSYMSVLLESGVIGFALIEWIWGKKMVLCFQFEGEQNERLFLFLITVFYIIESLLEGYPPFGPGVSSFMFWLLTEIILNQSQPNVER